MKALLVAIFAVLSIGPLSAAEPKFIIVTAATDWKDGLSCEVGEVERVVGESPQFYTILSSRGKSYELPRANAREVSAAEAATALLAQRTQLYAEIDALSASQRVASDPRPRQYNGRPLPRNWIDPKQADANFNAQQLQQSIDRNTRAIEQLRR